MLLEEIINKSKCDSVKIKCDSCNVEYNGRICTHFSQIERNGVDECRVCVSRRAGKKTALKMSKIYSEWYSGDGNPSRKPGVGEKISKAKKGKKLTESHKKALMKPKKKTDKIKEAANRPKEVLRRKNRMILDNPSKDPNVRKKISESVSELMSSGGFYRSLDKGWYSNKKTLSPIWCRSGLEKYFLDKIDDIDNVLYVESAEKIKIQYQFNGETKIYLPDFKVILKSGKEIIVETKSSYFRSFEKSIAKEKALVEFSERNGFDCITLDEKGIDVWLEKLKELNL